MIIITQFQWINVNQALATRASKTSSQEANPKERSSMNLSKNIDHLSETSGIEAVVVQVSHQGKREYRGNDKWFSILEGALDLFQRTNEPNIRLICGDRTVSVQKEGDETAATVIPTGHVVSKSLRRLIRRMAKKDRGPLEKSCSKCSSAVEPSEDTGSVPEGSDG